MKISTHAPLAGRDYIAFLLRLPHTYFNPRAPCGARPGEPGGGATPFTISTHAPLAGRDDQRAADNEPAHISTHAPLAGRDLFFYAETEARLSFQPTRPLRGATAGQRTRVSGT